MNPVSRIVLLSCLVFGGVLLQAQDPYSSRWAELRLRIATGGDVSELVREWGPKSPPPVRRASTNSSSGLQVSRLDPNRDRVRAAACQAGVHPALALAIVEHETGFNNRARGEKGEIGAGQIMPSTADKFGFDKGRLATDYDYNVRSSVAIVRFLLDYFNGDEQAAIRGYNGGPGWRNAGPVATNQIETYAASVSQLRKKYVPVTCG